MTAISIPNPNLPEDLDKDLSEWKKAEQQAKQWADRELELRNKIFARCFPNPVPGTKENKFKLPLGYTLVGDYRLNYKVDRALLNAAMAEPEIRPIIDEIITFDPRVSGSKFRGLSDNERKMISAMITETPGTPALEIKQYKRG